MLEPVFNKKCSKACHKSKKEAKIAMRVLNKTPKYTKKRLTGVYYCTICSAWHTTSIDKTISREIGDAMRKANELHSKVKPKRKS